MIDRMGPKISSLFTFIDVLADFRIVWRDSHPEIVVAVGVLLKIPWERAPVRYPSSLYMLAAFKTCA